MSLSRERSERRPTGLVLADLSDISALAERLDVKSPAADFNVGLTTTEL